MHPINILSLNRRISFINAGKYKKEDVYKRQYLDTLDKDTFAQWEDAIELLVRTANACGHPYQHPLTGISITEYSSYLLYTGWHDSH